MVISQNRGPQYRPKNTTVLIIGTPNKVPLILGNPYIRSLKGDTRSLDYRSFGSQGGMELDVGIRV